MVIPLLGGICAQPDEVGGSHRPRIAFAPATTPRCASGVGRDLKPATVFDVGTGPNGWRYSGQAGPDRSRRWTRPGGVRIALKT